jgi:hemerythrin-like domain-containing protein
MTAADTPPPAALPCADALDVLAGGHERTRALADECRRFARGVSPEHDMRRVADGLCRAIARMAALEEELFFPAARAALDAQSLVDLAELEHATARQIIRQLKACEPGSACYEALVLALTDCVERHSRHERSQLFPRLRESCLDLAALGERLNARMGDDERRAREMAAALH